MPYRQYEMPLSAIRTPSNTYRIAVLFLQNGELFLANRREIACNAFVLKIFVPLRTENKTELCWRNWRR